MADKSFVQVRLPVIYDIRELEIWGEKDDNEGVPFYLLIAPVMHRGDWNRRRKK